MENIDNIQQYEIYVDVEKVAPGCWDFIYDNGSRKRFPEYDFYLPLFLTKTYELYEYVQVNKEEEIIPIQRQEFNPYFIEFGFFDTIERNRVNKGGELTAAMLNFIRLRRPDVATLNDNELRNWFDDIGINEFPWNKGTTQETSIDDIDKVSFVAGHIVSKANYFKIDVNK
ncbi:MAG: hypothetical protein AABY15_04230 [Nanoarchaeota archaeon]